MPPDGSGNAIIISRIARETQRPYDEVKRIYDVEFARLKIGAKIPHFLTLLATRRTIESLAHSRATHTLPHLTVTATVSATVTATVSH